MEQRTLPYDLSKKLKAVCPRDNHTMSYENNGLRWKNAADGEAQSLSSYHCDFEGCSVRYTPTDGYFSVVETPDLPYFVEEPGANILQCPRHGTWLYESADEGDGKFAWRCGVEGCDYKKEV